MYFVFLYARNNPGTNLWVSNAWHYVLHVKELHNTSSVILDWMTTTIMGMHAWLKGMCEIYSFLPETRDKLSSKTVTAKANERWAFYQVTPTGFIYRFEKPTSKCPLSCKIIITREFRMIILCMLNFALCDSQQTRIPLKLVSTTIKYKLKKKKERQNCVDCKTFR